jgi:hypothetical protein
MTLEQYRTKYNYTYQKLAEVPGWYSDGVKD